MNRSALLNQVIAILGCVAFCAPLSAQLEAPLTPIDLGLARQYFDEAKALSDRDGGLLWGAALYGPMMLVDRNTRFIVTNAADGEGLLAAEARGLYTGTLPAEVNIANTAVTWAGVTWAMIVWPLPDDPRQRGLLMMHESFHRIQRDLGFEMAIRDNAHLDDSHGRTWLRLEWRALAEALSAADPLAGEPVRDALMFRAWRQRQARAAAAEENAVELNEGLAEYTGVRLGGYDTHDQALLTINMLRAYDRVANMSRSFAYATGPAYGLLLDRAEPGWRGRIGEVRDMAGMLRRSLRMATDDLTEEAVRARAERYDGAAIIAFESERQQQRDARVEELTRMFITGPTTRLVVDGDMQFSFSPAGAESLPGYGTVYAGMRITGSFGILESSGPVLWLTESERSHFRLPVSDELAIEGATAKAEKWTITLAEGWRMRQINTKGDHQVEKQR